MGAYPWKTLFRNIFEVEGDALTQMLPLAAEAKVTVKLKPQTASVLGFITQTW